MRSIRAVVFDAYGTLFDVYRVAVYTEQLLAGKSGTLSVPWRDRQIDYTRIHSLAGPSDEHYKSFWGIIVDVPHYAATCLGVELSAYDEATLMREYVYLSVFPENAPVLRHLCEMGLPLGILFDDNPQVLDITVKSAGMSGLFDHVLLVNAVKLYETAPQVYTLMPQAFGTSTGQILFVSSNGQDTCGVTWYGSTTPWIDRPGYSPRVLDAAPTTADHDTRGLLQFVQVTQTM